MDPASHLKLVRPGQPARSGLPTMTTEELGTLLTGWLKTARQNEEELADVLKALTGIAPDFGPGTPHPVPVCPRCGWTSVAENQADFQAEGPGTDHALGAHIRFTGCGHLWAIIEPPA